jgi:hypothetical protein
MSIRRRRWDQHTAMVGGPLPTAKESGSRLGQRSGMSPDPTCTDVALIGTLEQDSTTNEPGVTMRLFAVALLMPVAF